MLVLVALTAVVVVVAVALLSTALRRRRGLPNVFDTNQVEALRRDVAGALTRRIAPGVYRPGGILMRGKAAKHFRLAGRTLVIDADPALVAATIAGPVEAAKAKFHRVVELEDGEVAAWEADSIFGPFPRLVVRTRWPSGAEVCAVRIRVRLRFPQGGPFVDRAITAASAALVAAGLRVTEEPAEFAPGPDVAADGDGVWFRA